MLCAGWCSDLVQCWLDCTRHLYSNLIRCWLDTLHKPFVLWPGSMMSEHCTSCWYCDPVYCWMDTLHKSLILWPGLMLARCSAQITGRLTWAQHLLAHYTSYWYPQTWFSTGLSSLYKQMEDSDLVQHRSGTRQRWLWTLYGVFRFFLF